MFSPSPSNAHATDPASSGAPAFEDLAQRCLDKCEILSRQSEWKDGILRQYLSLPMKAVHDLASGWMKELGLDVRVDDAGNLIGRRPAMARDRTSGADKAPVLILGSHLDTVPGAGRYDGILGFVMGVELMHALHDHPLPFHVDVVGFSEEEGVRFTQPYLGSHALTGTFDEKWLERRDASGFAMASVIEGFGLTPARIAAAAYPSEEVLGFVEPHIEQGTVLAGNEAPLGVVQAIAGQTRSLVQFRGASAHAGTTPMMPRSDSLVAAAAWIGEVSKQGQAIAGCRATVGYADVTPNVRNVIPERVTLSLDLRHIDDATRRQAVAKLYSIAEGIAKRDRVSFHVMEQQEQSGVAMDDCLRSQLLQSMQACGLPSQELISGAGHDAGIMATRFPAAVLFLRQPRGISHHPDEDVEAVDVAHALRVLHHFLMHVDRETGNRQP
ncbi:MAG: Zn-dependent hydrolase [Planctomycetota bacterium]